ncbi:hypothetical protein N7462_004720 [Penicillium macrosclerotiorum]|uniref:uncharacterized protein n=1 Tax=Penicillium macrosclerotiorum TaxID=303699 RepID=UPI002548BD73|nr:uncharacterized protein N7462_004720 [Penicillium macrosclerotiorum]KAJ5690328.1 hypothetical protein N7462_004720 [Penicillium macrosclerotiorum]
MRANQRSLALITLSLQVSARVAAQEYTEKVWGVVAYTIHGDSTPNVLAENRPRFLSDYGANQLAAAGAAFRDRYLASGNSLNDSDTAIQYLSATALDSNDVEVYATTDQFVIASAQAFMQGLYPPVNQSGMAASDLGTNGTVISPLGGYQYPRIITLGEGDPQSIILDGQAECLMHEVAGSEYQDSSDVEQITAETEGFYLWLWRELLSGVYDRSSVTYTNAVDISDYMEYEALHNSTFIEYTPDDFMREARWLADRYTYATNSQSDSSSDRSTLDSINPIAGQTLASGIINAFNMNINGFGTGQKLTLLFGGDEPAVALASLVGLASEAQSNFYSRPVRGASLIFELYSFEEDETYPAYPGIDDLYVRFYLHNGTDSTPFSSFSMFGYGPSREYVSYVEFQSEMETFAVQSTQEWCLRCNANSVFCAGVLDSTNPDSEKKKKDLSPAVAGVIGAVVTIVVIGFLAVIGFFMCGVQKRRKDHKPSLGGFKGTNKLASDTDVTFRSPIWGGSKTANTDQNDVAGGIIVHGHERLGSWEMGQQKKEVEGVQSTSQRPFSALEDENEDEWRIHSGLQPVKVRESV